MVQARSPHPVDLPPAPAARPWSAILASLALHLGLVLVIFLLRRHAPEDAAPVEPASPAPSVQMVYLQPPRPEAPPERPPQPAPPTPPPPEHPKTPPAPPHDEPAPMAPEARPTPPDPTPPATPPRPVAPDGATAGPAPAPRSEAAPSATATMESEARRIFGRHKPSATQAGPVQVAGLPVYIPDDGRNRCTPKPREPDAPVQLGTVRGRVTTRSGTPLPGAHLQILGTPYVTFADGTGAYTLTFDKRLVDDCRSQVVRVTAPGFRAMNLVLAVGPTGTNDVEMARQ